MARPPGVHLRLGKCKSEWALPLSHTAARMLGKVPHHTFTPHHPRFATLVRSALTPSLRPHAHVAPLVLSPPSLALLSPPRNRTDVADFKREQVKRVEQGTQTVLRIQQTLRGSVLRQVLDPFFKMCSFFAEEE